VRRGFNAAAKARESDLRSSRLVNDHPARAKNYVAWVGLTIAESADTRPLDSAELSDSSVRNAACEREQLNPGAAVDVLRRRPPLNAVFTSTTFRHPGNMLAERTDYVTGNAVRSSSVEPDRQSLTRRKEDASMIRNGFVMACMLSLGLGSSLLAKDDNSLAFDGGIGVIPVSNVTVNADGSVTVSRNIVRGVNPAGQIWVIDALEAEVSGDEIRARGRGLLLGGGNNIGTNANASVFATLICGQAAPTLHSTPTAGVPLAANGDFEVDDVLSPAPPFDCVSPVLLIRSSAGANAWFAAGILKREGDN
jgi:hypothetical protein